MISKQLLINKEYNAILPAIKKLIIELNQTNVKLSQYQNFQLWIINLKEKEDILHYNYQHQMIVMKVIIKLLMQLTLHKMILTL